MKRIFRPRCLDCGEPYSKERWRIGIMYCLDCGDVRAKEKKFTIAIPFNKGAYQYIHNPEDLCFTNPKRTT